MSILEIAVSILSPLVGTGIVAIVIMYGNQRANNANITALGKENDVLNIVVSNLQSDFRQHEKLNEITNTNIEKSLSAIEKNLELLINIHKLENKIA